MTPLALAFGAIVGLSLGLTGGGGSIIAVPLLVYGLSMPAKEATGVSLAAVGATALVGAIQRLWRGEVELRTGLTFAVAGIAGAPIGAFLGRRVPEPLLLGLFAALMLAVAFQMWRKASRHPAEASVVRAPGGDPPPSEAALACRRDPAGRLVLTSRCATVMIGAGVATGVLSGLFGVGGGFVVVPALVLLSGMGIHRAVATSLLVIAIVAAAGVASKVLAGEPMAAGVTTLFALGGVVGLALGTLIARRVSPAKLQQVFAVAIVAVALFVIVKSVV